MHNLFHLEVNLGAGEQCVHFITDILPVPTPLPQVTKQILGEAPHPGKHSCL